MVDPGFGCDHLIPVQVNKAYRNGCRPQIHRKSDPLRPFFRCFLPLFIRQKGIAPGEIAEPVSILDLAPTVASLLGIPADPDWEGRSLL